MGHGLEFNTGLFSRTPLLSSRAPLATILHPQVRYYGLRKDAQEPESPPPSAENPGKKATPTDNEKLDDEAKAMAKPFSDRAITWLRNMPANFVEELK